MRNKILTFSVGIVAVTAVLAGCGGQTPGSPQPTGSDGGSSSAAAPGGDAPKPQHPINTDAFKSKLCNVITPAQQKELGIVVQTHPTSIGPFPACRYEDTSSSAGKMSFSIGANNGLSELYSNKADAKVWEPLTIDGFPAVNYGIVDGRNSGQCSLSIGTSDHDGWSLGFSLGLDEPNQNDPCPRAVKVAQMMLATLKGGS